MLDAKNYTQVYDTHQILSYRKNRYYSHPSVNAVGVAAQEPRKAKFALCKSKYRKKNCQKNLHNAEILYYKIVLCKFFWTSSKNRAMENRVSRGMPVLCTYIKIQRYSVTHRCYLNSYHEKKEFQNSNVGGKRIENSYRCRKY